MYSTPILFLIFNRPAQTKKVFEAIKEIKPEYLYIAADGPRQSKPGEAEQCDQTRKLVLDGINWDCKVVTLFRDKNLGCGRAVSEAITWFFENVEEGIILEDDCLPDKSFFMLCETLLEKYRHNEQIMHIGGCNFQNGITTGNSYYFSNYIHIWGWATWRRAWTSYQLNIPGVIDNEVQYLLKVKFRNTFERAFWKNSFETVGQGKIDTWDIQWVYNIYKNSGLGITPNVNLISNIGFGIDATHTTEFNMKSAERPLESLTGIKHPKKIRANKKADNYTFKTQFEHGNNRLNLIKYKIGQQLPWVKKLYLNAFKKRSTI